MNLNKKNNAFTLSEVLITITLIGFLATMTLSTVGSSVQQRARLAEFRTAYAKLDAALRSITIDEGKVYSCYVIPSNAEINDYGLRIQGAPGAKNTECLNFTRVFAKAMGSIRSCEDNPIDEGCLPENYPTATGEGTTCFQNYANSNVYVLDNSMFLIMNGTDYLRLFAIDVNGRKGPNKWGQDIFPFSIKASESKQINGRTFVTNVGIFAPGTDTCQPADGASSKSTQQMIAESAGMND